VYHYCKQATAPERPTNAAAANAQTWKGHLTMVDVARTLASHGGWRGKIADLDSCVKGCNLRIGTRTAT
jgi:hypothetical protein